MAMFTFPCVTHNGRFPYLLPNLVGAGMSLLALPLVLVFIKDIKDTPSTPSKDPA